MLQLALLSALALSPQPRLLAAEDAPLAGGAPTQAAPSPTLSVTPKASGAQPLSWGYQMGAGAAAAIVFVPVSLYFGEWLGSLSNDLIWSAIPVLLSMGLIPPIAVTLATVIAGNWNDPGRYRWWPALLATLLINGVSLPIAASLGLSVGMFGRVAVYTLAQAVLQPGAATLLERAWPRQTPTVLTVKDPIAPTTFVAPTATWSF